MSMDEERLAFWRALCAPFADFKQRRGSGNQMLSYITARQVMNRLDTVAGPEGWWDEYLPGKESVICRLTIRLPDGSTITKQDAGGYAGMSDSGDDEKSGYSDAFKRAAVKFGVGRHLYGDGVPHWAVAAERARSSPQNPAPQQVQSPPRPAAQPATNNNGESNSRMFEVPKLIAGKNVAWAWVKNLEQHFRVNLVNCVKQDAADHGFPSLWKDWTQAQMDTMAACLIARLAKLDHYNGEFDSVQVPVAASSEGEGDAADDEIPF